MGVPTLPDWITWLLLISSIIGASITFWRVFVTMRRIAHWIRDKSEEVLAVWNGLTKQFQPNGGDSVADQIRVMADGITKIAENTEAQIDRQAQHETHIEEVVVPRLEAAIAGNSQRVLDAVQKQAQLPPPPEGSA